MKGHKVGIIVPYRDRYSQLFEFKQTITEYFRKTQLKYHLIVVEQDDAKLFNRGMLLNIGFLEAKRHRCDYVCFHDVDMLPSKVDYGYSDVPIHLATVLVTSKNKNKPIFDQYFGGVTLFPSEVFEKINGYSNKYWGWGFEDDDLLWRCLEYNIPCDTKLLDNSGPKTASLKFNGLDSYVKFNNTIDFKKDFSLFISFQPSHSDFDVNKRDDFFTAFGIPGYDFNIGWNSFNRFKIEFFNKRKKYFQIFSEEDSMRKVTMVVTYNAKRKVIEGYLNGELIASQDLDTDIFDYSTSATAYLGISDATREKECKHFSGVIDSFAAYDCRLNRLEVEAISKNRYFGLTTPFKGYKSSKHLTTYYDGKFIKDYKLIDISGNNNTGIVVNCEIVPTDLESTTVIPKPFRRLGRFKLLDHQDEGFVSDSWKNVNTRYNQLRFNNEVKKKWHNPEKDGLNTLAYKTHSSTSTGSMKHIIVGL